MLTITAEIITKSGTLFRPLAPAQAGDFQVGDR